MCVFSLEVLYSTRFELVRLEGIFFFFNSKSTISLFIEYLYKVQLAFSMIIFLNKKKSKEFTYFMLMTGMKQKVFFNKNNVRCSSVGLWLTVLSCLSSICGLGEG